MPAMHLVDKCPVCSKRHTVWTEEHEPETGRQFVFICANTQKQAIFPIGAYSLMSDIRPNGVVAKPVPAPG